MISVIRGARGCAMPACLAFALVGALPAESLGQLRVTGARVMVGNFEGLHFVAQQEVSEVQPGQLFTIELEVTNAGTETWDVINIYSWEWSGDARIDEVFKAWIACAYLRSLQPGESFLMRPFCGGQAFQAVSAGVAVFDVTVSHGEQTIGAATLHLRIGHGPQADLDGDQDVDADDFARYEACTTGPAVPYDPHNLSAECSEVPNGSGRIAPDLDADGDVDQEDFGLFQRCYSGEGSPADPDCAG